MDNLPGINLGDFFNESQDQGDGSNGFFVVETSNRCDSCITGSGI